MTNGITTRRYVPHPALQDLLKHIVVIDMDLGRSPVKQEGYFMPSPDQAVFINIFARFKARKIDEAGFTTRSACTVVGPLYTPFKLLAEESILSIVVVFQPGGLNRFLHVPMTEIFDNGFDGRELIGRDIEELVDSCHEGLSMDDLNRVVQDYFLRRSWSFKEELPLDRALRYLTTNHNAPIEEIAGLGGVSIRQLERKCKERLGMSPKMYARIARFSKAYQVIRDKPDPTWTDISYRTGYFDQMHFIRDFKEFARQTPTIMRRELSEERVHFQLDWEAT